MIYFTPYLSFPLLSAPVSELLILIGEGELMRKNERSQILISAPWEGKNRSLSLLKGGMPGWGDRTPVENVEGKKGNTRNVTLMVSIVSFK